MKSVMYVLWAMPIDDESIVFATENEFARVGDNRVLVYLPDEKEAKKSLPKIAVGTVYRNLNELAEVGIIRKIEVPNAPDRFDKTVAPHEHLICPECGAVEDLAITGLDTLLQSAMG